MLNARLSPSASVAFGMNAYELLAFTAVGALPEIVGFWFDGTAGAGVGVGAGAGAVDAAAGGDASSSPPPQPVIATALNAINNAQPTAPRLPDFERRDCVFTCDHPLLPGA